MSDLTTKQMVQILLGDLKEHREDWKEFKKNQNKVNELVIRHDEKIKNIWRIPIVSGSVITFLGILFTVINMFLI